MKDRTDGGGNGRPDDFIFIGAIRSRDRMHLLAFAGVSLMLAPVVFMPERFSLLPYSIPITGLWLWNIYLFLVPRAWSVSVSPSLVTWDRFCGKPHRVAVANIIEVVLDAEESPPHIYLALRNGHRVRIAPWITSWVDHNALVDALRTVVTRAHSED